MGSASNVDAIRRLSCLGGVLSLDSLEAQGGQWIKAAGI